MSTHDITPQQQLLLSVRAMLARYGDEALEGKTPDMAARNWIEAGFSDEADIDDWLNACCFNPLCAQQLDSAGITPEQGALRTRAGRTAVEETVACKFSRGELTLEEVRRIVTSDFWNS